MTEKKRWFERRALDAARRNAFECAVCQAKLKTEVWLTRLPLELYMPDEFTTEYRSLRAPTCQECAFQYVNESWFYPSVPCEGCGRVVHRMRPHSPSTSFEVQWLGKPARERAYCSQRRQSTAAKRRHRKAEEERFHAWLRGDGPRPKSF